MSTGTATMTGVVCDDRSEVRQAVVAVLTRCGFQAVGVTGYSELRHHVHEVQPTVVVLSLPVVGISSLDVVGTLCGEAPACEIVILSAFHELHLAAIEAGAGALVPEEDPLALQAVLLQVAARQRGAAMVNPVPAQATSAAAATGASACAGRTGNSSTNPES